MLKFLWDMTVFTTVFCRTHFFVGLRIGANSPDFLAAQHPCLLSMMAGQMDRRTNPCMDAWLKRSGSGQKNLETSPLPSQFTVKVFNPSSSRLLSLMKFKLWNRIIEFCHYAESVSLLKHDFGFVYAVCDCSCSAIAVWKHRHSLSDLCSNNELVYLEITKFSTLIIF